MVSKMRNQDQAFDGVDLTTIKVRLRYPSTEFFLFMSELCPYAIKLKLALEWKKQATDFDFGLVNIGPQLQDFSKEQKNQYLRLSQPQLRVVFSHSGDENWLVSTRQIVKLLDSQFPKNPLLPEDNPKLSLEIALFDDWIDEAFHLPYFGLLYLNENNYKLAAKSWLAEESIIARTKLELFRKNKAKQIANLISKEQAEARLDNDLLPLLTDKIEYARKKNSNFIFGDKPSLADFSAYGFLKSLLQLKESNLVIRRGVLLRFIEDMENLPFLSQNIEKKQYNRQKIQILPPAPVEAPQQQSYAH